MGGPRPAANSAAAPRVAVVEDVINVPIIDHRSNLCPRPFDDGPAVHVLASTQCGSRGQRVTPPPAGRNLEHETAAPNCLPRATTKRRNGSSPGRIKCRMQIGAIGFRNAERLRPGPRPGLIPRAAPGGLRGHLASRPPCRGAAAHAARRGVKRRETCRNSRAAITSLSPEINTPTIQFT